jgi:7-cyano-7-deazaguanine synthase
MGAAVAVVSGGIDSVTLAHLLADEGHRLTLVSFDYGQRHVKELDCAARTAGRLGATHHVVDLRPLGALLTSALTSGGAEIPEGHYTDASMEATVVPNRNAILLSVATGVAVAEGADCVAIGVHGGDHPVYPDCRPAFIAAFEHMARLANEGFAHPDLAIRAPFLDLDKAHIVATADRLGVPLDDTWSCYVGGDKHCGRCGTCVERREAFALAGVDDPTSYEA